MDYKEHIGGALEYIEANLKSELTLRGMASAAGYSEYHFLRVFKQVTRLTPAGYVRKRRLTEVVREMEKGVRSVSEIAFDFGFNSKENFTRAFKTEHHVLPTECKSAGNSLQLFGRFALAVPSFKIQPKLVTLDAFSLTVFPNPTDSPPKFWNVYNCKKLSLLLSGGKIVKDYGVVENGQYFIGIKKDEAIADVPGTMEYKIPAGLYAVFKTPPSSRLSFVNVIHRTWAYIGEWLTQNGYRRTGNSEFETYVETSRTFSEDIFIPVTKND